MGKKRRKRWRWRASSPQALLHLDPCGPIWTHVDQRCSLILLLLPFFTSHRLFFFFYNIPSFSVFSSGLFWTTVLQWPSSTDSSSWFHSVIRPLCLMSVVVHRLLIKFPSPWLPLLRDRKTKHQRGPNQLFSVCILVCDVLIDEEVLLVLMMKPSEPRRRLKRGAVLLSLYLVCLSGKSLPHFDLFVSFLFLYCWHTHLTVELNNMFLLGSSPPTDLFPVRCWSS